MVQPPNRGTHGHPSKDDEPVDGVVLFDPSEPDRPELGQESWPSGPNWTIVALVAIAIGLGGYQLLFRPGPAAEEAPAVPELVPSGFQPVEEALVPLAGNVQSAQVGTDLTVEVRARSAVGTPIADSLVQFVVLEGDGVLEPDASRTDQDGIARTTLVVPERVGENVVVARLFGSELEARILVRGTPGPPTRVIATEGNAQEAEVTGLVGERATVLVTDAAGNPVPGVEVLFDAGGGEGGFAAPARWRTDSLGVASTMWRLGMTIGTQEPRATVRQTGASVTFRANALGRPTQIEGAPREVERGPVTVVPRGFVVGGSFVCQLVGGTPSCRGANDRGQTAAAGSAFVALTAGVSHVCGLDASGTALCWGANEGGQLGDGSRTDRSSATPVRTEVRFGSLTGGQSHTCGLSGGIAVCWGQNLSGQLGDGSRTDARFPRAVGGGITFRALVAGWDHTCGISTNGNAFCWGPNDEGQLGDGSRLDRLTPTPVRGSIESLAAGSAHTCGVSGNSVLCWGANRFGQLGDGTNESRTQPVQVVGLPSTATAITAGAVHTCALVVDGSAYCWGQNLRGQLGIGSTENQNRATAVSGGLRFRSLHAGGAQTCGVTTDGAQYCWGMNQEGQLGDGTRESKTAPVRIGG